MVPDFCEAVIDIRLVPSVNLQSARNLIQDEIEKICRLRSPLQVEIFQVSHVPPTEISSSSKVLKALRKSAKSVLGKELPLTVSGPANESYILNGLGIPTCVYGPNGGNVHSADEYVMVDSIFSAAQVYAETAISITI